MPLIKFFRQHSPFPFSEHIMLFYQVFIPIYREPKNYDFDYCFETPENGGFNFMALSFNPISRFGRGGSGRPSSPPGYDLYLPKGSSLWY